MSARIALQVLALVAIVLVPAPARAQRPSKERVRSIVAAIRADGSGPRVIRALAGRFEAPNWSPDNSYLLLNSAGKLWRLPLEGGELERVPTGVVETINNDHGIAPDGRTLAISAGPIYLLPAEGGAPRRLTEHAPSYFHGFAPDGKTLAFCGRRRSNFDLFAIGHDGGPERRLTVHPGYDDGPDYAPDGRSIYFNSDRSGSWDIWRIPAAGAGPDDRDAVRITRDELEDWFPHPSPDGKWLVFLSFPKGTVGHPPDRDVILRIMPMPGASVADRPEVRELLRFRGGQGSINVNSWSPDGRRLAFVRYELTAPAPDPK